MSRIAQIRRKELLAATLAVIARKGLSGITVNDIAREAGCSFGVVAFHFKTKEALLVAALNSLVEEYDTVWSRAASIRTGREAAAELEAMIDTDFGPQVTTQGKLAVWTAFWGESSRVPTYKSLCGKLKRRYRREVAKLIELIAEEHDSKVDSVAIAAGLNALVDGFWIYGHVTGEFGAAERARGAMACRALLQAAFPAFFPANQVRKPSGRQEGRTRETAQARPAR